MSKAQSDLGRLMERFFRTFPGYEDVDVLIPTPPPDMDKADHLLFNRAVVAEQKDLMEFEFKLGSKFLKHEEAMIEKYGADPDTGRLKFAALTEQERTKADHLIADAGDKIKKKLAKANSQIRDTKKILNIPGASGLLIMFLDSRPDASPLYIKDYLHDKMKPDHKGIMHYPEIKAFFVVMRLSGFTVAGCKVFYFAYPVKPVSAAYLVAMQAGLQIHAQSKDHVMGGVFSDNPTWQIDNLKEEWTSVQGSSQRGYPRAPS